MQLAALLTGLLVYVMFPLWIAAGAADWLCHRASHIETTSGAPESSLHLLLFAQIAIPVLAVLFFEVNAALLVLGLIAVVLHMATSLWDTTYSQPRRHISPLEQHVHAWLEMLPLFALALAVVLNWDQVLEPAFAFVIRDPSLPAGTIATVCGALFIAIALIVEELVRGLRARDH